MNVAAHQEKKKNEETKTGKRKADKRRQATNFEEAACCPNLVVQGAAGEKMVCARGVLRVTGTLGKANSHFDPIQTGSGTTLRQLLVGAENLRFALCSGSTRMLILYFSQKAFTSAIQSKDVKGTRGLCGQIK